MRYLPSAPTQMSWEAEWDWWVGRRNRADRMVEVEYWRVSAPDYHANPPGRAATRPIGVVHCDRETGEVGILMGERSLWGLGLGKQALLMFLEELVGEPHIWALVHPAHEASLALFHRLGFKDAGEGRNGQLRLELR
jgi:RimJ/RimL family protein N-acetyltransferase